MLRALLDKFKCLSFLDLFLAKKSIVSILSLLLLIFCLQAQAFNIVGSWKLVSIQQENNTQILPSCYSPIGMLIYTASGYMSASINCMETQGSKTPSFSPKDMTFYSGKYVLNKNKITHVVQYASTNTYYGKLLERQIEIINDKEIILTVKTQGGGFVSLTWHKVD